MCVSQTVGHFNRRRNSSIEVLHTTEPSDWLSVNCEPDAYGPLVSTRRDLVQPPFTMYDYSPLHSDGDYILSTLPLSRSSDTSIVTLIMTGDHSADSSVDCDA